MTGKWQNNVKTKCLWQISFSCNFIMFLSLSCQFSLISLMFSWLYYVCCYVPMFFFTFLMFFLSFLYFFIGFLHFSIDFFPFSLLSITVSLFFSSIPLVSRFFHWFTLLFHCFSLIVQWFCWFHARNDWKYNIYIHIRLSILIYIYLVSHRHPKGRLRLDHARRVRAIDCNLLYIAAEKLVHCRLPFWKSGIPGQNNKISQFYKHVQQWPTVKKQRHSKCYLHNSS